MPKTVFSTITDTLTFFLNIPIVPPRPKGTKDVALVELPHSMCQRSAEAEAPELRRLEVRRIWQLEMISVG